MYGMSAFGLTRQLGIPRAEAQEYLDTYFARYTGVRDYMDDIKAKAKEGIGVLMVLHDLNLATRFSDKVVILKNGMVIDYGDPVSVMEGELLSSVYGLPITVDPYSKIITYY